MSKIKNNKADLILDYRKNHKMSYLEISKLLGVSKRMIHYYCKKHNLTDIGLTHAKVDKTTRKGMIEYRKTHSLVETAAKFNVSSATVINHTKKVSNEKK